jgi:hypothetical protein
MVTEKQPISFKIAAILLGVQRRPLENVVGRLP